MAVPAGMLVLEDEPLVAAGVLPVFGTDPPLVAGGGVEAPPPQALKTIAAIRTMNTDKFKFFFIFFFSPYIFSYAPILSTHL